MGDGAADEEDAAAGVGMTGMGSSVVSTSSTLMALKRAAVGMRLEKTAGLLVLVEVALEAVPAGLR
jgi:hypothetical protein